MKRFLPDTPALRQVRRLLDRRERLYDVIAASGMTPQRFDLMGIISRRIKALVPATGAPTRVSTWETHRDTQAPAWWLGKRPLAR